MNYRPFIDPLPIYSYWYWLILPLCLMFSIVYKAVKVEVVRDIPKAALAITFWILLGIAASAVGLAILVKVMSW